jgi:hypothetical protein
MRPAELPRNSLHLKEKSPAPEGAGDSIYVFLIAKSTSDQGSANTISTPELRDEFSSLR